MRFSWEVYKRVSFCYILFLSKEIGIYLKTFGCRLLDEKLFGVIIGYCIYSENKVFIIIINSFKSITVSVSMIA